MSALMDKVLAHHSPGAMARAEMEYRVISAVLRETKKAGYELVNVFDGEVYTKIKSRAQAMALIFDLDESYLYFKKGPAAGAGNLKWVRLVMGNDGWDVVNDHTWDGGDECLDPAPGTFAAAIDAATKPFSDRYG